MEQDRIAACQEAIAHQFREPAWLEKALTHSSNRSDLGLSNERMEFLGDAILGMVVSEYLFQTYQGHPEGELTAVKSIVVSERTLARQSRALHLDQFLSVGRGMSHGRRLPNSVVANVFEALVAAVYLDQGLEAARAFVLRNLEREIHDAERTKLIKNCKSALQQLVQRRRGCTPTYRVIEESGPDHAKSFRVVTMIEGVEYGTGWGRNKKEAEQHSARETLALVKTLWNAPEPAPGPSDAKPEPSAEPRPEPKPEANPPET
ncbi:MAG TPA: ribonuclease III [Planctomycetota bacterium]|nr:ribonuclease III [Planctomycetota bacterium]HRT96441.1 ribonuclease III [Planctomycetota bacterium]